MTFTFKKGKHRARPVYWLFWFFWLIKPVDLKRRVKFTLASTYDFKTDDQEDWNKLFGISFGRDHHYCSARYGWRYSPNRGMFELAYYCYLNGTPHYELLCELYPGVSYDCHIIITHEEYIFRVYNKVSGNHVCTKSISKGHRKSNGFLLGPFFGGNRTPDKTISISLEKFR